MKGETPIILCDCADFNTREFSCEILLKSDAFSLNAEDICLLAMLRGDLPAILEIMPVPISGRGLDADDAECLSQPK